MDDVRKTMPTSALDIFRSAVKAGVFNEEHRKSWETIKAAGEAIHILDDVMEHSVLPTDGKAGRQLVFKTVVSFCKHNPKLAVVCIEALAMFIAGLSMQDMNNKSDAILKALQYVADNLLPLRNKDMLDVMRSFIDPTGDSDYNPIVHLNKIMQANPKLTAVCKTIVLALTPQQQQ